MADLDAVDVAHGIEAAALTAVTRASGSRSVFIPFDSRQVIAGAVLDAVRELLIQEGRRQVEAELAAAPPPGPAHTCADEHGEDGCYACNDEIHPLLMMAVPATSGNEDHPSGTVSQCSRIARDVAEFHVHIGSPPWSGTLADMPERQVLTRNRLVAEEVSELIGATAAGDLVGIADGLADVVYVAYGTAYTYGVDLDAVLAEVHRSNMTKDPGATGKAVKGARYTPPDIRAVLDSAEVLPPAGGIEQPRARFDLYCDGRGQYRWRLTAGDGTPLATGGEGYQSKAGALNCIEAVQRDAPSARTVDTTGGDQ